MKQSETQLGKAYIKAKGENSGNETLTDRQKRSLPGDATQPKDTSAKIDTVSRRYETINFPIYASDDRPWRSKFSQGKVLVDPYENQKDLGIKAEEKGEARLTYDRVKNELKVEILGSLGEKLKTSKNVMLSGNTINLKEKEIKDSADAVISYLKKYGFNTVYSAPLLKGVGTSVMERKASMDAVIKKLLGRKYTR